MHKRIYTCNVWNTLSSTQKRDWWVKEVASLFTMALPDDEWLVDGLEGKV